MQALQPFLQDPAKLWELVEPHAKWALDNMPTENVLYSSSLRATSAQVITLVFGEKVGFTALVPLAFAANDDAQRTFLVSAGLYVGLPIMREVAVRAGAKSVYKVGELFVTGVWKAVSTPFAYIARKISPPENTELELLKAEKLELLNKIKTLKKQLKPKKDPGEKTKKD